MSPIVENMSHPLAYRLGWVLLHSLWQGALVGVVFGLCRSALKKSSPNARYLAGCIALGLLIGIPAITFFSQPGTSFQNETASGELQNGHAIGGGGSRADLGIAAEAFVR